MKFRLPVKLIYCWKLNLNICYRLACVSGAWLRKTYLTNFTQIRLNWKSVEATSEESVNAFQRKIWKVHIHDHWSVNQVLLRQSKSTGLGRTSITWKANTSFSLITVKNILWKHFECCRKRLENPISIVLSNCIVWRCPWCGNILEKNWKYFGNRGESWLPWSQRFSFTAKRISSDRQRSGESSNLLAR